MSDFIFYNCDIGGILSSHFCDKIFTMPPKKNTDKPAENGVNVESAEDEMAALEKEEQELALKIKVAEKRRQVEKMRLHAVEGAD